MTLPAEQTKVNFDAAADDPKQARSELAGNVDKFNTLRTHLLSSAITQYPLVVGDGLKNVSNTSLAVDALSGGGVQAPAGGVQLDINGLTAEAAPADGDYIAIYDVTAGAHRKVLKSDLVSASPLTGFSSIELVRKSANETINSSTTLQNDDALFISLAANENVFFTLYLRINSVSAADFQYAFTVPTGATVGHNFWFGTNPVDETQGSGTPEVVATTGNDQSFVIQGFVANSTNTGNLQLQWAQSISNAGNTTVLANSYMIVYRV